MVESTQQTGSNKERIFDPNDAQVDVFKNGTAQIEQIQKAEEMDMQMQQAVGIVSAFEDAGVMLETSVRKEQDLMAIYDFLPSEQYLRKMTDPEHLQAKLDSRVRLMDFVEAKQTDFVKYRDTILNTFGTLNILKSNLATLYQTMERSGYSDEIMQGIVKSQAKDLQEKIKELKTIEESMRETSLEVPKKISDSIKTLGIDGKSQIKQLLDDLDDLGKRSTKIAVEKAEKEQEKSETVTKYMMNENTKTRTLQQLVSKYSTTHQLLAEVIKKQDDEAAKIKAIELESAQKQKEFAEWLEEENKKVKEQKEQEYNTMKEKGESYIMGLKEEAENQLEEQKKRVEKTLEELTANQQLNFHADHEKAKKEVTQEYKKQNLVLAESIETNFATAARLRVTKPPLKEYTETTGSWFWKKTETKTYYDYAFAEAEKKKGNELYNDTEKDQQRYEQGLQKALIEPQKKYDEQIAKQRYEYQQLKDQEVRQQSEVTKLEDKIKGVITMFQEFEKNKEGGFNEQAAMKNLIEYQEDRKKRFDKENEEYTKKQIQICNKRLEVINGESKRYVKVYGVTEEVKGEQESAAQAKAVHGVCNATPGMGGHPLDEMIRNYQIEIENLKNKYAADMEQFDKELEQIKTKEEKIQKEIEEKQKESAARTQDVPLELKQLFAVSTIISDTNKSIQVSSIVNQVLPVTCKTMYEYFLQATQFLEHGVPPLPTGEELKAIEQEALEDVEAWSCETQEGNEETNLQLEFREKILKPAFKGPKKELAEKFMATIAFETIQSIQDDIEKPAGKREFFEGDYKAFYNFSKSKIAVVYRDSKAAIVKGKTIGQRRDLIKVNFVDAVRTCQELPNHVVLQQKLMAVGKELAEKIAAQKLATLENADQEQKALAEN